VANLLLLTALLAARAPLKLTVAIAILGSMCINFALNRRFSASTARASAWPRPFVRFVLASSPGALVNYLATILTLARFPGLPPQLAAIAGIAAGAAVNLVASRYLVFRATHVRVQRKSG
jgi:putative flippase GtrA